MGATQGGSDGSSVWLQGPGLRSGAAVLLAPVLAFCVVVIGLHFAKQPRPPTRPPTPVSWAGRAFTERSRLAGWLEARGGSYATWAYFHPAAAARIRVLSPQAAAARRKAAEVRKAAEFRGTVPKPGLAQGTSEWLLACLGAGALLAAAAAFTVALRRRRGRASMRRPGRGRPLAPAGDWLDDLAPPGGLWPLRGPPHEQRRLGELLVETGLLTNDALHLALEIQKQTGARLGEVLVYARAISDEDLASTLARQHDLPLGDITACRPDPAAVALVPYALAWRYRALPLGLQNGVLEIATAEPLDGGLTEFARRTLKARVERSIVPAGAVEELLQRTYAGLKLRTATSGLLDRAPDESAFRVLSRGQKIVFGAVAAALCGLLAWAPLPTLIALNLLATLVFVAVSAYRLRLMSRSLGRTGGLAASPEEVAQLADHDLPPYTILVPLYHEREVLPRLLSSLSQLDYPAMKLDVKLIVEEDDDETLAALQEHDLPPYFKFVVVPDASPKTKAKACNFGLTEAEGDYTVIYDAEDRPEPDQLKKAVIGFRKSPPQTVCLQSKLNYYNRDQNFLTRCFATEYSLLFDLFLPALDASGAPIPLGGTSNHFKTEVLRRLGGWDPFNVTEDADLGIRLFKAGYETKMINSTTFEEANSALGNWIRQRSRWVKGYTQTWLVQMRHPLELAKQIGWRNWWSFQLVVGGTVLTLLVNPLYWLMTGVWFGTRFHLIEAAFPGYVYFPAAIALFVGNFAFVYMNVAAVVQRRYYHLVKYGIVSPIYWALMSIGAWKGLLQLFRRPYYWEKTRHGLDLLHGVGPLP